ncbi:serine hydrolase [Actibacterium sp. 188UL27-1]|uniref:serine hydrolase domain-containing protein n=1 Tax=Actibacterium sp. 188UL27-1 TaxID=2786961 RepID=UPI00195DF9DD|nr:serine hydrolase [Actibacterium sp. 188UL27-1]MBM7067730.1 serine hydrolase [Actibacterium sp. 188UL27-1]
MSVLKWVLRGVGAIAGLAAIIGIWKWEEIGRLLAVNSLFAEDKIVSNFSSMDQLFLHTVLPRGDGAVSELPQGVQLVLPDGATTWIEARNVTGLVVLHQGKLVFEEHYQGTKADDRRISWSVAKSFLSVLMGTLVDDGTITDLDAPVTQYAPSLAGGAYDAVSIRNVLQMSSGVVFDEDYLDFYSDINRMGRVLALGASMDDFAAGLTESFAVPGTDWQYVSIDTHVLGMVIRGATGRSIPDLMTERVIKPLGLEADPIYLTDGDGVAFVLGGLNLRIRDYARFGQMVLEGGQWNGHRIVSERWLAESMTASAKTREGEQGYGYQWWTPHDARPGEVYAHGIYSQFLYLDQAQEVVIIATSADRGFRGAGVKAGNIDQLRQIADAAADLE